MKPNSKQLALGIVVLLLICTVAFNRLRSRILDSNNLNSKVCVGVKHPEIGRGLACTHDPAEVINEAILEFGVPKDCTKIALPKNLPLGTQVVLDDLDGTCILKEIGRLPGEIRVLTGGKFNVNEDKKADLIVLPQIGEIKATAIVQSRRDEGLYEDLYDLMRVRGIGEKTIERLDPWLEW